jgi:hypothetical protein
MLKSFSSQILKFHHQKAAPRKSFIIQTFQMINDALPNVFCPLYILNRITKLRNTCQTEIFELKKTKQKWMMDRNVKQND